MHISINNGVDNVLIESNSASKLRLAAYIRVSTESEEQENSFETQMKYFENLTSKSDKYTRAGIYSDYGISGTSFHNRPGMRNLLEDCKNGKIDCVICKSMSRFARNSLEFIQMMRILKDNNVRIIFEKENIDTSNPMNEMAVTALAAIAQKESQSIAENINWSNERRYQSGEVKNELMYGYRWCDDYTIFPSGYRYQNIEPVPEEACVVKRIFEDAANGVKYADIARQLNKEKITPPRKFGYKRNSSECYSKWTGMNISNMIKNERYTGSVLTPKVYTVDTLSHKRKCNHGETDQYMIKNHHPAIISMELFDAVQIVRQRNSARPCINRTGKRRIQKLSGLLWCKNCGKVFHANGRNKKPYWHCSQHCGKQIDETVTFKLIRQAFCRKFGTSDNFIQNIHLMYQNMDALHQQKNRINNELTSSYSRSEAININIQMLTQKAEKTKDERFNKILYKNINFMEQRLSSEIENSVMLNTKLEEIKELDRKYFEYCDLRREFLKRLDMCKNSGMILEEIVQNYLKAIIIKIIVISAENIIVQWIDNSFTEINGGKKYVS